MAAINDGMRKARDMASSEMSKITGGLKIPGLIHMSAYPAPLARLVQELSKLPGIGEKTAARLAFHMLKGKKDDVLQSCRQYRQVAQRNGALPNLLRIQRGRSAKRRNECLHNLPKS